MKYCAIAILALMACGCESFGFTQAEVDAAVARAGAAAADKARAETEARLFKVFVDMGMTQEEAKLLASIEGEKASEVARLAAEELVRRTMPVKPPGGDGTLGKILMAVVGAGLQFGLSYAEMKTRED